MVARAAEGDLAKMQYALEQGIDPNCWSARLAEDGKTLESAWTRAVDHQKHNVLNFLLKQEEFDINDLHLKIIPTSIIAFGKVMFTPQGLF